MPMTESSQLLTPKQEAFAQQFVELGNAAAAYRKAYAVSATTKPSSIWVNASKLFASTKVAQRVTELQAENAQRHEITIDSVTEQLTKAYEMAIARRQPSAAVGACMALARLHGLFTSRVEVQARNYVISTEPEGGIVSEAPPHPMTDEEWEAKYGDPTSSSGSNPPSTLNAR